MDAYYAQDTSEKVLYLTFDAGYENGNTPAESLSCSLPAKPYSTQYNARNTRTASDRAATSSLTFACRTTTDTVESAIPRRSAISAVE